MWCYYFDKRLPEHEQVRDIMRKTITSEDIVCNTLIILEVAHYLVRHFTGSTARKKIEYFTNLSNLTIVDFDRQSMTQALESLIEHGYSDGLGGRDATVLATMNSKEIKTILSHDEVFKRLATKLELQVIDPISPDSIAKH
jgi:predicted nucleic acid-binding protein